MENKLLKGEGFLNRYRITGTLKTISPLHIGTGEESDTVYSKTNLEKLQKEMEKVPLVSTVMKDVHGKPIIPGSALRGVMRHWLLNVLTGFSTDWATTRNYEDDALVNLTQAEQINKVKSEFSWLEILFGTPFHEGKIEVWDAECFTKSMPAPDGLLNWNSKSLTYIDTSVAIDPTTGTAMEHLLYKAEVVPPGVEFKFNLAGQNLTNTELGLVLLALQGFNSVIYPIRIGARGGRGYGRVCFIPGPVYGLEQCDVKDWIKRTIENFGSAQSSDDPSLPKDNQNAAGYYALPEIDKARQKELITKVKTQLNKLMNKPVENKSTKEE